MRVWGRDIYDLSQYRIHENKQIPWLVVCWPGHLAGWDIEHCHPRVLIKILELSWGCLGLSVLWDLIWWSPDHPDNYSCELLGQMCRGLPTYIGGLGVISSYHYWKHPSSHAPPPIVFFVYIFFKAGKGKQSSQLSYFPLNVIIMSSPQPEIGEHHKCGYWVLSYAGLRNLEAFSR